MKRADFLHADTNFGKAKNWFDNYCVGIVKNGWGLIDSGTLKSGVSHKWFDELSKLIEEFSHVDNVWFDNQSTLFLEYLNPGRPLQLYIARVFRRNSLFLCFEKFCCWFLLERYLNKNWYYSEMNLTGRDLGFTKSFWIFTIKLFVIMNSFTVTKRNKN